MKKKYFTEDRNKNLTDIANNLEESKRLPVRLKQKTKNQSMQIGNN